MVTKFSKFSKKKTSLFENTIAAGVFVVIFVGIIGFFIFQNIHIEQKRAGLEERLRELRAQAGALSTQKAQLEEDVADMQTEEYQEKVLREQGLYKKESEQVITVLPPEILFEEAPTEEESNRVWWQPWTW